MLNETLVALGSTALGVVGLWATSHLEFFGPIGPGAGMMPITLCIGLIMLSLANLAAAIRSPAGRWSAPTGLNWRVAGLFSYYALYIVAMYYLGFVVSTFLFTFGICCVAERKYIVFGLACAVLTPVILYLIFSIGLNVSLPSGLIL